MDTRNNIQHVANVYLRHFALLVIAGFALAFAGTSVRADVDTATVDTGASEIIQTLSDQLAQGRNHAYSELSRLGFEAEVDALQKQSVSLLNNFSTRSVIESMYRRAEAHGAGEGDRFLAVLYQDARSRSAALDVDPNLAVYKERFSEADLDLGKHPIQFAPISARSDFVNRPPLSHSAETVIVLLSEAYSGRGLAQMRLYALRNFRAPAFDARAFERTLLESHTPEEALRRMVAIGTPPPGPEIALLTLLSDAMARSASLSIDPKALKIVEPLWGKGTPKQQRSEAAARAQRMKEWMATQKTEMAAKKALEGRKKAGDKAQKRSPGPRK